MTRIPDRPAAPPARRFVDIDFDDDSGVDDIALLEENVAAEAV